jgi:hypothetical protein
MTPKLYAVLCLFGLDFAILVVAVGTSYIWLRATHTPLRVYQKKLLFYSTLLMASCPILGPLWLASVYWLMRLKPSSAAAIVLFLIWGVVAFPITQRLFRPGSCLNKEQA